MGLSNWLPGFYEVGPSFGGPPAFHTELDR
jgi:hypothetical protein